MGNTIKYLSELSKGDRGRIIKIEENRIAKRLIEMGLVPDREFEVLYSDHGKKIVRTLNNLRIAIGEDIAKKILVEVYKK